MGLGLDPYGVCKEFVLDLHGVCMGLLWDLCGALRMPLWGTCIGTQPLLQPPASPLLAVFSVRLL